jgi:hypothetical protein
LWNTPKGRIEVFYGLKDRMRRWRFARECDGVLDTPPVPLDAASEIVLLSQLQHKDLLMYLLAAKSFARRVNPRAVYVVDDGTLSRDDRALLGDHVPGLTLLALPEFRSERCPFGGTWERLLAISLLVQESYVVQLDSDTLTLGAIEEVSKCVKTSTAFAIGTWDNQKIESMEERCGTAKVKLEQGDGHVQVLAEARFDMLHDFASLRYVRGCSGFAGFPKQSFTRAFVETVSEQMRGALGDRWSDWGSEQVMSNIVVANIARATVLPHPKYADCHKMQPGATEFVHFIGGCRFDGGHYARLGAQVIDEL